MTTLSLHTAIQIEAEDWKTICPGVADMCLKAVDTAWKIGSGALPSDHQILKTPDNPFEVSIVLSTDETVRKLNADYRGKNTPTNVLSFPGDLSSPAPGIEILLGDVILGLETVQREASEMAKTVPEHVHHLVIHGVLHLLGYDHESEQDATTMERLEVECMAHLGLPDPYAIAR